jgi:tetratricopeptide (TPR) repeat protein
MTDFISACAWLLRFDQSHLSGQTLKSFKIIDADLAVHDWPPILSGSPDLPDARMVAAAIAEVDEYSEKYIDDPLEFPEVLVRLARHYLRTGKPQEALTSLSRAYQLYTGLMEKPVDSSVDISYLQAVVAWMIGLVCVQLRNSRMAYPYWAESFAAFVTIAKNLNGNYAEPQVQFCGEQLEAMQTALICLPETAFNWLDLKDQRWLDKFGGKKRMDASSQRIKEILANRLEEQDMAGVYAELENFRRIATESVRSLNPTLVYAEADALLACGLFLLWMGNIEKARSSLNEAVIKYLPDTHPRCIAYWLAGIAFWEPPVRKTEAISNWQSAIHGFKKLEYQANYEHLRSARDWYRKHRFFMERALEKRIDENFG